MTVGHMRKIGPASDPRSSSFVVFPNEAGQLMVWGLIDQQNRYEDFLNKENTSGPERPGIFEARIVGPGHLSVGIEYEKVAELRLDELQAETIDVFSAGPLLEALTPGIVSLLHYASEHLPADSVEEWIASLKEIWIDTLVRILLRVRGFRHGGAILLTPDTTLRGLNVKYTIAYDRVRTAVERYSVSYAQSIILWRSIFSRSDTGVGSLDWKDYFEKRVVERDRDESESELQSAIWFASLLSRVDGLVLLSPELNIRGFGVEITTTEKPHRLKKAVSARAKPRQLVDDEYNRFGTRHRSMMRYCDSVPGSVGFVVSQDGDVRAMTRVRNNLVFWENIRLQTEFREVKVRRKRKPKTG